MTFVIWVWSIPAFKWIFVGDFMLDANDISTAKSEEVCCFIVYPPHRTQGQSVRNGATKVFKHWQKSPWVPTLTGPFANSQANTGSWLGTKNTLYYCAQSANRFSWVRSQWLLSCHSCAVYSRSFLNQTKELPMSRKMFWMLSAWARENSVSDRSQCVVNNRKFKMRRRRTRNQKKQ